MLPAKPSTHCPNEKDLSVNFDNKSRNHVIPGSSFKGQHLAPKFDYLRPTSAPPTDVFHNYGEPSRRALEENNSSFLLTPAQSKNKAQEGSPIQEGDPRSKPEYAAFFYNYSRLDPRLPPPIYSPGQSSWRWWPSTAPSGDLGAVPPNQNANTSTSIQTQNIEQVSSFPSAASYMIHHSTTRRRTSMDFGLSGSVPIKPPENELSHSEDPSRKKKGLVDMIQEDFPRTPSPVFGSDVASLKKDKEGKKGNDSENSKKKDFDSGSLASSISSLVDSPTHRHTGSGSHRLENANGAEHHLESLGDLMNDLSLDQKTLYHSSTGRYPKSKIANLPSNEPAVDSFGSRGNDSFMPTFPTGSRRFGKGPRASDEKFSREIRETYPSSIQTGTVLPPATISTSYPLSATLERPRPDTYYSPFSSFEDVRLRGPLLTPDYTEGIHPAAFPFTNSNDAFSVHGFVEPLNNSYTSGAEADESFFKARSTLLDTFRANKNRRFEVRDIVDHIVEFSGDQYGSRFIQLKLEAPTSPDDRALIFHEIISAAVPLMTDVFGNYVIQKFFELGTAGQRSLLASKMAGHVVSLSLQMYGCRVVQKALEFVSREQQETLVAELDGHVLRLVKDQNGNHVIQKCIERVSARHIQFIIEAFQTQIYALATHPYGCRVMQRIFEHAHPQDQVAPLLEELHRFTLTLVQDQYGNYVVQHILERGHSRDKRKIMAVLKPHIVNLSRHKFASNVMEKCVSYGDIYDLADMISIITAEKAETQSDDYNSALDNNRVDRPFNPSVLAPPAEHVLLVMMRDPFANYVVQKMLDIVSSPVQRHLVISKAHW
jgi:hypothetical protein